MQRMLQLLSVKTLKYESNKAKNKTCRKQRLADVVYNTDLNIQLFQIKHFMSKHVNKSVN